MQTIFLDTNIFLHFKLFNQIPWDNIINSKKVKIIIAPIVISELDKHKYNERAKIRTRANKILKIFHKYIEKELTTQINDKLELCFLVNQPLIETFNKFSLNISSQDDHLLASIKEYKIYENEEPAILITSDIGPILKAKQLNIKTLKMPEEYKLPFELDTTAKKIAKLEKENINFKNRIPVLKIYFSNKKIVKHFSIKHPIKFDSEYIEYKIKELKEKYPKKSKDDLPSIGSNFQFGLNKIMASIINKDKDLIEEYNKNLDNFFERYKAYLIEYLYYLSQRRLSFEINFFVFNEGNVPAKDIDILLHFPDGLSLSRKIDQIKKPKKPYPPRLKSPFEFNFPIFPSFPSINNYIPNLDNVKIRNVSIPSIKKTHSYDVKFNIKYLKHNQYETLEPLIITFESYESFNNFSIDYKIQTSNVPQEKSGSLNLINKVT